MNKKKTDFAYKLKYHRKSKNLTMKELAEKIGVHFTLISKYEKGLSNPSVDVLKKIADVLEVKQAELFGEELKLEGMDGASRELIERAEKLGLEWISVTEHFKENYSIEDIEEMIKLLEIIKKKK